MPHGGTLMLRLQNMRLAAQRRLKGEEVAGGDYVCLTVTDTGRGFDPQVLPHIFKPFYTNKGVGEVLRECQGNGSLIDLLMTVVVMHGRNGRELAAF